MSSGLAVPSPGPRNCFGKRHSRFGIFLVIRGGAAQCAPRAHTWPAPLCVTRPRLAFVCVTDPCRREVRVSKARRLVLQDNGT